ncbi:MAG: restriction endonuclease subunit S [Deltaproteobacteria bacterium CG06_land_8_20_14_3_00_44_19]|nr:MAG: restriction endonuclease subunit S [Deltaproteobacteria bacterium CG06_land_8_20_14_3_00_44_19]
MSEWKECKLGEVVKLVGGGTPKTNVLEYWNGDIPWLSVTDFNTGNKYVYHTEKTITNKGLENSSTKLLDEGDIIISARGTVGVLAVLKKKMAFNQTSYGIKNIPGISDSNYLYYLTKDSINNLKQISYGGVFDTITRVTFNQINILLPPLPEQRAIAGVLSSLDDKIDLLHRQNKTLEGMAEALWRKMFVEEADPNWKKGKLGDEMNITMGQSPPGHTYNEEKQGIIFFQGRAEFDFRFPQTRLYCTEPKRFAKRCDTLVSVRAPVGDINMATEDCCIGRGLAAVKHKKGFVSYTFYKIRSFKDDFDSFEQQGTVFGSIGKDDFNGIDTFIPDLKTVQQFDTMAKPLDDKIFMNSIQIHTLSKMRDKLLPNLVSGEVRVRL